MDGQIYISCRLRFMGALRKIFSNTFLLINCFVALFVLGTLALFIDSVRAANQEYKDIARGNALIIENKVRDVYIAQNDLYRLFGAILKLSDGQITEGDAHREISVANDMLWVRANDIVSTNEVSDDRYDIYNVGIKLLDVTEEIDKVLTFPNPTLAAGLLEVLDTLDEVRIMIRRSNEKLSRELDTYLSDQSSTLKTQNTTMLSLASVLSVSAIALLLLLARELEIRKAREQAEKEVQFLAYHDHLTKLPNRIKFTSVVKPLLEDCPQGSIWMLDLDNFKGINDTVGHDAGDLVLRVVSSRLNDIFVENSGIVCRISGDEFLGWIPNASLSKIHEIADCILDRCSDPISYNSGRLMSRLSIGIVPIFLVDVKSRKLEKLIRYADFTLYSAKESGKSQYKTFTSNLSAEYIEKSRIINELGSDIESGDVQTYFQPKFELKSLQIYGFEALARWDYEGSAFSPELFVRFAEDSGLIYDLDKQILSSALKFLSRWNECNGTNFSLSVNISAAHFNNEHNFDHIFDSLQESGFPPSLLTLEVTESVEVHDFRRVKKVIKTLKEFGCKISIDDFGVGYSSLACIEKFDADEIKLDKSLIEDVGSSDKARFLVKSIVEYAKVYLSMSVVCEGIESSEQLDILNDVGCHFGQGYICGSALPMSAALKFAHEHNSLKKSALPTE